MTRAGKKALREASEEAHQRQTEKAQKDAEERKQRSNDHVSNTLAEFSFEADKSFWTPASQTEKKRMTTVANSIYKLAQKFDDNKDDVTPSMLILARDSLPAALKLLRMPDNWEMDEGCDGVDTNVQVTMTMLCSLAPKAEVRLSRAEISDIWDITNLLRIADYDWWDSHWKKQYEPLITKCFLSEGIAVLAEIAQQDCPGKGTLCYDFFAKIVDNDCTEDDLLRICAAYTHVLSDPRTEEFTNGMIYAAIFEISNQLRWTQILCDNLLEPARQAAMDENVEFDCYCECDYQLLLLRLSKALAKAKVRTAEGLTSEQLGRLDDDDDKSGDVVCELLTSEEWSFFFEVFEQNSFGIEICDCAVKEPLLRCDNKKMAALYNEMNELLLRNNASVLEAVDSESDNLVYERLRGVVTSANKVLTLHRDSAAYDYFPYGIIGRKSKGDIKALLLRGKSYRAMGRFDDALDDFYKIENFIHVLSSWYKLDEPRMEAALEAVKTLRDMKQYKTAIDQANKLLGNSCPTSMIEARKSKIRDLLAEIVAEGEIDAPNPAAAMEVIEGEANSQDVDFAVAHCNWKQIGMKDENFYWVKEVQVIPRLRWVLARVRGDLLIWDYDKEEVVHFITLEQPSGQHQTTTCHLIDMPELNAVLYFRAYAPKSFWILNLQALTPRGGRTDATELSLPLMLTSGVLCGRTYTYFLGNASQLYSNVASIAASKNDSGQWRLALSYRDHRGVSIYKADRIRTGTLLGPFLVTGERSLEIAGDASLDICEVRQMQIIGTGSLLVTVAHESKKIYVWDALGPLSPGTCLQVFRRETTSLRSLCCSKSLLFTTSQYQTGSRCHLLEISVWALRPTTNVSDNNHAPLVCSPVRAILKNPPNLSAGIPKVTGGHAAANYYEQQLAVLPQSSLLVSSHGDGTVNIWRYDDDAAQEGVAGPVAVHLRTFLISRGHQFDFRFLVASRTSPAMVYMADSFSLFAIDLSSVDAVSGEAGEEVCVRDRRLFNRAVVEAEVGDGPKLLNCFTCGKWDVEHSSYCGNCKSVSFCGPDCLKKGWSEHKEECQKASSL